MTNPKQASEAIETPTAEGVKEEQTLEQQVAMLKSLNAGYEEYVSDLEANLERAQLPEAAGSVNVILNATTKDGGAYTVQLTARGRNTVNAIDDLHTGMEYAYRKYGWLPARPARSAPESLPIAPSPSVQGGPIPRAEVSPGLNQQGQPQQTVRIIPTASATPGVPGYSAGQPINDPNNDAPIKVRVLMISHQVSDKGQHHIKCTIDHPRFRKYGLKAWKESLPDDVAAVYEDWQIGTDFAPPTSMQYATTAFGNKKVSHFTES